MAFRMKKSVCVACWSTLAKSNARSVSSFQRFWKSIAVRFNHRSELLIQRLFHFGTSFGYFFWITPTTFTAKAATLSHQLFVVISYSSYGR